MGGSGNVAYGVRQMEFWICVATSGLLISYHGLDLLLGPFLVGVERVCELGPDCVPVACHGLQDTMSSSAPSRQPWSVYNEGRSDWWRRGKEARQVVLARPEFLDLLVGSFKGGAGMVVNAAEDGGLESCTITHDQVVCAI